MTIGENIRGIRKARGMKLIELAEKAGYAYLINSITDVADSINKGYITHKDIEDIMLEEYDIQLCDNNGDVRRI